jgi:hypothetical protein
MQLQYSMKEYKIYNQAHELNNEFDKIKATTTNL